MAGSSQDHLFALFAYLFIVGTIKRVVLTEDAKQEESHA
jgi:hypothetical protein